MAERAQRRDAEAAAKRRQVLLIDDNEDDRQILERVFEGGGSRAELLTAGSGPEGLDVIAKRADENASPDLVLLDLNMPGMTGLETLERIRALDAGRLVPIIVFTTSDSDTDVIRSYELGANSFVTKPIDLDDVIRVVSEIDEYWFDLTALPRRPQG
ncbi:MAG: response regulator [Parvularculaceae bacterium]